MRTFLNLATVIISCLVLVADAYSEVIHVPGDASTIQGGIDLASTGDVVRIGPGTYVESLYLSKGITLEGASGAEFTVIEGLNSWPIIECLHIDGSPGFTIRGLTLRNGYKKSGNGNGGGAFVGDAVGTIEDCIFEGNAALFAGGGIAVQNADLLVRSTVFRNNSVPVTGNAFGGAVSCTQTNATFEDCRFESNAANYGGEFGCPPLRCGALHRQHRRQLVRERSRLSGGDHGVQQCLEQRRVRLRLCTVRNKLQR